jgi:hypothetical protein
MSTVRVHGVYSLNLLLLILNVIDKQSNRSTLPGYPASMHDRLLGINLHVPDNVVA